MAKPTISVCMITLGRDSIYKTLESLFSQKISVAFEIVLILQGNVDKKRIASMNTSKVPVKIYDYELGLGFAYYRNQAIKKAKGEIIAFIDDDEWTKDHKWLHTLTKPIRDGKYLVTTSGYIVDLNQSYMTDCISLLGYPGGGALGFEKMWTVYNDGTTKHICSGNLAFSRKINIQFDESLKSGAEDVQFGYSIINANMKIKYVPRARVGHVSRSGLKSFFIWHIRRGKSVYEFNKLGLINKDVASNRMRSVKNIFTNVLFTKYIFGVTFLFFVQYLATLVGYFSRRER